MPNGLRAPSTGLLLCLIAATIGLDQVTKWLASSYLDYGRPVPILPVLNLTLLHNTGAAFSFLSNAGGWQRWLFLAISSGVSLAFLVWLWRTPATQWLIRVSLALIIAGALGNLVDRAHLGYVIDFISVHWRQHYFPAFNVADSAITVGAMLMIIDILWQPGAGDHD